MVQPWQDGQVIKAEALNELNQFLTRNFIAKASDLDLDSNYKDFDLVPVNSVVTYAYIGAEVLHQ
ncbi:hypothetical protein, partial [Leuconostoc mesenteroides]|uniref:hypothetical protein n=1 Tax=Leuconostoc mesenteroides TaxID=1245 RepID=UPI000682D2FF